MTSGPSISPDEEALLRRAEAYEGPLDFPEIQRREGLDFAMAVLYAEVRRRPGNEEFWQAVCSLEATPCLNVDLIAVVPGAFYRTHRDTGADGWRVREIARELGCAAEVIPVKSFGGVEENARMILCWLADRPERRIGLISLSKGGLEVRCLLAKPEAREALEKVVGWINFSGMVHGTPLVDWLRRRRLRWWAARLMLWWGGHEARALEDLRATDREWSDLPEHLRVVHVYGFPWQRHLHHRWAPRGYRRLAGLGPNDGGGILLEEALRVPGIVCPIWGADHYLDPPWDAAELLRRIVARGLSQPAQASQKENPPTASPAARSQA